MQRYGITLPFDGVPLLEHEDWIRELADRGYTDFWSAESGGTDAFTPLILAAQWAPESRVGTAIVPVYTRGPATLASCAASLAEAAPGRAVLGLGSSSNVIVESWNATPFEKPYARVRDTVRFLKSALAGEKVSETYETFTVKGFRLNRLPETPPTLMIAALRKGMLGLAGRESDGAILNWLSAEDVATVAPLVHAGGEGRELVARLFVLPTENVGLVRAVGRRAIAAYLNVPVYAAFHEWLGRSEQLGDMWKHWKSGDRKAALEAVPDEVIDALIIHGSPAACREHVARYVENGLHTPVLALLPGDYDAQLTRSPDDLTVLDVVALVDPLPRITQCPLDLVSHQAKLCPLHARLDSAMDAVESAFRETTIEELLTNRPRQTKQCPFPVQIETR